MNKQNNTPSSSEKILDELLANYALPAPDLADRICYACEKDARKRRQRWITFWSFARNAAALVIVATLSSYLTARRMLRPTPPTMIASTISTQTHLAASSQGFSLQDSLKLKCVDKGNTITNLQRVSTTGEQVAGVQTNNNRKQSAMPPPPPPHAKMAPKEITQVWIVDKQTDILSQLPNAKQIGIADGNGTLTYCMTLSHDELTALVTRLHDEQKWSLLSTRQPQPGMKTPTDMTSQPCTYTLKIIPQ